MASKVKLSAYYAMRYLSNPSYINASLFDTIFAFVCYYLINPQYINIYSYTEWNEQRVVSTLVSEYDWELAQDTTTTWRIGDGTAAFYNYIYYVVAGFTEHDAFRSNQIREGVLAREEALRVTRIENRPRYESIRWYCDTIGIDCDKAIETIHAIPRLYRGNGTMYARPSVRHAPSAQRSRGD